MGQVNLGDYKNLYLQTAKEYLEKLSISLDGLLNDVSDKDALNNLHIASHSLKSESQLMGRTEIASLSANLEKTADDVLNGEGKVDDQFIILLKDSIEGIKSELATIEKGNIA